MTEFETGDDDARFAGLDLLATAVLLLGGERRIVYANAAARNVVRRARRLHP